MVAALEDSEFPFFRFIQNEESGSGKSFFEWHGDVSQFWDSASISEKLPPSGCMNSSSEELDLCKDPRVSLSLPPRRRMPTILSTSRAVQHQNSKNTSVAFSFTWIEHFSLPADSHTPKCKQALIVGLKRPRMAYSQRFLYWWMCENGTL